jgi:hypothetical protein
VYATIGWMEQQREAGTSVSNDAALEKLELEWATRGPIGGFEAYYKSAAAHMVQAMAAAIANEDGQYDREEWIVPIGSHEVAITPDRVLVAPDGAIRVQRVRTGRKTKSEAENGVYALLRRGAVIRYPGAQTSVETFYLATGERTPMDFGKDDKQLQQYGDAIDAIERGEFPKKLDARRCPNCPSYFICGA